MEARDYAHFERPGTSNEGLILVSRPKGYGPEKKPCKCFHKGETATKTMALYSDP